MIRSPSSKAPSREAASLRSATSFAAPGKWERATARGLCHSENDRHSWVENYTLKQSRYGWAGWCPSWQTWFVTRELEILTIYFELISNYCSSRGVRHHKFMEDHSIYNTLPDFFHAFLRPNYKWDQHSPVASSGMISRFHVLPVVKPCSVSSIEAMKTGWPPANKKCLGMGWFMLISDGYIYSNL